MNRALCFNCISQGYCKNEVARLVTDAEIANQHWVRDIRLFAATFSIQPCDWAEYLTNLYRDYLGWIIDPTGSETFLNLDPLFEQNARFFFRDFCRAPNPKANCFVRPQSWERVRVLATILRARFPAEAQMWGVRAANDNYKTPM